MTIFEIQLFGITLAPSYYGLMYAIAFLAWYYYILKKNILTKDQLESLFLYVIFWVILWWRLGYILFYDLSFYLNDLSNIVKVWQGGMSFHGWAIGLILSVILFAKVHKVNFYKVIDEIVFILPIWLFLGRIWNYLNKELLGFPYTWFLAVEKNGGSYFPSPLLEAFLEWIVLFIIFWFLYKKRSFYGQIWVAFLIGYWVFRTFVELFFRLPDPQIGYIAWFFTMGSLLSIPMIIIWIILYFTLRNKNKIWM
jgi:phosphatidylglycerol:prolipoprotein diacylglycerol transferase